MKPGSCRQGELGAAEGVAELISDILKAKGLTHASPGQSPGATHGRWNQEPPIALDILMSVETN